MDVSWSRNDVFISYAQDDRSLVRKLARALEANNWKIWWDEMIPTGQKWRSAINQNLNEASCVLVVWTKASVNREWVLEEAKFARNQDKLVQVIFDIGQPPMGFGEVQALKISKNKISNKSELKELFDSISALTSIRDQARQHVSKVRPKGVSSSNFTRRLCTVPDLPDLRDRLYEPPTMLNLSLREYPAFDTRILDQKSENASVGFAVASVINRLNQARGMQDPWVSVKMLYEMSKPHQLENNAFDSLRPVLRGFKSTGVCSERSWPYRSKINELTTKRAKLAKLNKPYSYYRLKHNLTDFQSAIKDLGTICVSARIHRGWRFPSKGIIKYQGETLGGHAFAIVGYDDNGFLIQNSWGEDWGNSGYAIWLYEDWKQNLMDAWVFNLALPAPEKLLLDSGEKFQNDFQELSAPQRSEIAGHYVQITDGEFHTKGDYWSNAADVRTTAKQLTKYKKKYKHLVLYTHGGLESSKATACRIATLSRTFKKNGIYSYHFLHDMSIMEELKDVVLRRKSMVEERTGDSGDWSDRLIEWSTCIPGRMLWREIKTGASRSFSHDFAGTKTLKIFLAELSQKVDLNISVHVVGHSSGVILLAYLLRAMEELAPELRIRTCSLLAPACSISLFRSHYYPYLLTNKNHFGIDKMRVFNLTGRLERDDHVGFIYRKSLLYLVSRAFEEDVPEEILGMKQYTDPLLMEPAIRKLGRKFCVHYSSANISSETNSSTHGGFDNDVATMNTVLKTILDLGEMEFSHRPFTSDSLNY